MYAPVTFPNALTFWLYYPNFENLPVASLTSRSLSFQTGKDELADLLPDFGIQPPYHIMVPQKTRRNHDSLFVPHTWSDKLPFGCFRKLTDDIAIISPELCFLLSAKYLPLHELVVLGNDLCGIYALDNKSDFGQNRRTPVTNRVKISSFVDRAHGIKGVQKARTAVKYLLNNSNSPMESRIAAITVLRNQFGGFSIFNPDLNYEVELSQEGKSLLDRDQCCCDMVWKKQGVIVEYDSDLAHFTKKQFRYDKKRGTALQMSGYKVLTVTKDFNRNFDSVEEQFLMIRKALGMRFDKHAFQRTADIRREVIKTLFLTYDYSYMNTIEQAMCAEKASTIIV